MNESSSIIPYLFSLTFILVLLIGFWQYRKVTKAKEALSARELWMEQIQKAAADFS